MRPKSKFVTFLLSFLPGLSHFYLGYVERGFIYLILFCGLCVGTFGLAVITNNNDVAVLLAGVPIIWLVALVDAFSTLSKIRHNKYTNTMEDKIDPIETKEMNKKIITLALSMIPGAGHMYLGYQQKGLMLMGTFFFSIFLMGWLNLSLLLFILPLIWFYSFFDAFHTLNGNDVQDMDLSKFLPTIRPAIKPEYIGKGLILVGLLIMLQKVFYPVLEQVLSPIFKVYIVRQIRDYIQTSIVSLIFIIGGIKMLQKKKIVEEELEEEIKDEE